MFYWITRNGIQECSLGLQNVIALIDEILAGTGHGLYLNRCTLTGYFSGGGGVSPGVGAHFSITKSGYHEMAAIQKLLIWGISSAKCRKCMYCMMQSIQGMLEGTMYIQYIPVGHFFFFIPFILFSALRSVLGHGFLFFFFSLSGEVYFYPKMQ